MQRPVGLVRESRLHPYLRSGKQPSTMARGAGVGMLATGAPLDNALREGSVRSPARPGRVPAW